MEQLTRYDITKLNDPKCLNNSRPTIRQFANNSYTNSIDSLDKRWNKVQDIINNVSDAILGK